MTVLASGSKGNATVIAAGATRILVDAGLSCRELLRRMAEEEPRLLGEGLPPELEWFVLADLGVRPAKARVERAGAASAAAARAGRVATAWLACRPACG